MTAESPSSPRPDHPRESPPALVSVLVDGALLAEAGRRVRGRSASEVAEGALVAVITEGRRRQAVAAELRRYRAGQYRALARSRVSGWAASGQQAASGQLVGWLADISALALTDRPPVVGERLGLLLRAGLLHSCPALELQVLTGARSTAAHRRLVRDRTLAYRQLPADAAVIRRALSLQATLIHRGRPDSVPGAHLLVAATALHCGIGVLHHDPAFTLLGQVCGLAEADVLTDRW